MRSTHNFKENMGNAQKDKIEMKKIDTEKKPSVRAAEKAPDKIPLSKIQLSELNPRSQSAVQVDSLSSDIAKQGLLQPITLRGKSSGVYEVVIGSRRLRAILAERGPDGVLNAGEFTIIDWNDDKCIQAAISENNERTDLSPLEEARYIKTLARLLAEKGVTVTDELLEQKTGMDRPRINDLRQLADSIDSLTEKWRDQLGRPANRRSSDNSPDDVTTITLTHWKHIRALVKGPVDKRLARLMDRAASEKWSCARFKDEVDSFKSEEGLTAKLRKIVPERDPNAAPNYQVVLKGLKSAVVQVGNDDEVAMEINKLIIRLEDLLKKQKAVEAVSAEKPQEEAA